jgi:hypothetical protein
MKPMNVNISRCRCILDRIVHKIGHRPLKHFQIPFHHQGIRHIAGQGEPLVFSQGPKSATAPRTTSVMFTGPWSTSPAPASVLEIISMVLIISSKAVALFDGAAGQGQFISAAGFSGDADFCHPANPRNRAFQVMGDIITHLTDPDDQLFDAIQHLVESHRQAVDLFVAGHDRHPPTKVGFGNLACRTGHRFDPGRARLAMNQPTITAVRISADMAMRKIFLKMTIKAVSFSME